MLHVLLNHVYSHVIIHLTYVRKENGSTSLLPTQSKLKLFQKTTKHRNLRYLKHDIVSA